MIDPLPRARSSLGPAGIDGGVEDGPPNDRQMTEEDWFFRRFFDFWLGPAR